MRQLAPSPEYIRAEMQRQLGEIERRRNTYTGGMPPIELAGRAVIIIDDGIATGGTVRAALKGVGKDFPSRLVLAVPVASAETIAALRADCDAVVCLEQPDPFYSIGAHYDDFAQTSDEEVVRLLRQARNRKDAVAQVKVSPCWINPTSCGRRPRDCWRAYRSRGPTAGLAARRSQSRLRGRVSPSAGRGGGGRGQRPRRWVHSATVEGHHEAHAAKLAAGRAAANAVARSYPPNPTAASAA